MSEVELRKRIIELSGEAGFYKGLLEGIFAQLRAEGNWYTLSIETYRKAKESFEKANKNFGVSQRNNVDSVVSRMRLLEKDHTPDGWPAVQMKDISALCDIAEIVAGLLSDFVGICPVDQFNWEPPFDCEKTCRNDDKNCWLVYIGG